MKLSLLANAALSPIIELLRALSPHETTLTLLSDQPRTARRQFRAAAESAYGSDAVLLLDGTDLLPEADWRNGSTPLVVPRVHNAAALLLGGNDEYRRLFRAYDGGIAWFIPGARREYCPGPREDCQVLCALGGTQLELPDSALAARAVARYNNWDYFDHPCDFSLIESLLGGEWPVQDAIVFAPGALVTAQN